MKIVYLAAGAGGMYCGSCLHDNTLAAALIAAGHDATLLPFYTPIRTDEHNVSDRHLFFGGLNVYLQQHWPLFRHTPWFLDAILDAPVLIRLAMKFAAGVEAEKLGELTVSMLQGDDGNQSKELAKLIDWLHAARPDVVHLSNCLLMGIARDIRRLPCPVVCTLSGEDIFLERLKEPHYSQARDLLRQRAGDVDAYVAMNRYYANAMSDYLGVPSAMIEVIRHGLNLEGHGTRTVRDGGSVTIGYLARICPEKGLHHLVAAFEHLQQMPGLPPLRLRAAGYIGASDRAYLAAIQERAQTWPEPRQFEYVGEVNRDEKIAFLQSLDIFSVPTVYRESKGLSVLEAMANAVPAVLPEHGAFPEMIADTGGGILHEPENPHALADALKRLIDDPALAAELGRRGQQAVRDRYNAGAMCRKTLVLYERIGSEFAGFRASPCAPPA